MTSNTNPAKQVFLDVIEKHSAENWESALASLCGEDQALVKEVNVLLKGHIEFNSMLDGAGIGYTMSAEDSLSVASGTRVGPYKLLEPIGEGGMGTVYMAEQLEPVKRRVAIKLIKPGMDSKQVSARFEAERQALAMMDHPNIAKIHDGGTTDAGRPYFVMELVKGLPITKYCDLQKLPMDSRLKLFRQVCQAVQHAHQKGIIHRDLKPSNIMVAMYDDQPVPKVIDFGVAKATSESLTKNTFFTRFGEVVGTLTYMSPEQAQFNQLDIDTRSDVYSLGAVLYELLVGEPPFDHVRMKSQAFDETLRMIREEEPTRPSTRLSSTERSANAATNRSTTSEKLNSTIRGDLDWIVLKALEKDRSRRYETANELASDISRYLNDEPVQASPPSTIYQFRKFARRNKTGVAIAVVSLLLLLAGAAGLAVSNSLIRIEQNKTLVAFKEAERQRGRAIAAEGRANARAAELKVVSKFQSSLLSQIDPFVAGNQLTEDVTAKLEAALAKSGLSEDHRAEQIESFSNLWRRVNTTDTTIEFINQIVLKPALTEIEKRFADQPLVDARLRLVVSNIYYSLGMYDVALPLVEQSLATRSRILGTGDVETLESLADYAFCLGKSGNLKDAEPFMRDVLEKSRLALGDENRETLNRLKGLGNFLIDLNGPNEEAEQCVREALAGQLGLLGDKHEDTLNSMLNLAEILAKKDEYSEAETYLRKAVNGFRNELSEDHPTMIRANYIRGLLLAKQGNFAEAELISRESLESRRRVLGNHHPKTLDSLSNLATLLLEMGQPNEAGQYLREGVELSRRLQGDEHPATLNWIHNLGSYFIQQKKWDEAEPLLREAVETKKRVLSPGHLHTIRSMIYLGIALRKQDKLHEAEQCLREGLVLGGRVLAKSQPEMLGLILNLSMVLEASRQYDKAVELLIPIKDTASKALTGNDAAVYGQLLLTLGNAQMGLGEFPAAETNLLEALPLFVEHRGRSHRRTIECTRAIVKLYTAWRESEPDQDYEAKITEWQNNLNALVPPSQGGTDQEAKK